MRITPMRLRTESLAQIAAAQPQIAIPDYPRNYQKRICHIGVGGFHRAHQARYLDLLLRQGESDGWGICGVSLLPSDAALLKAMQEQDLLYSLWEMSGQSHRTAVIGSIMEFLDASQSSAIAIDALTDECTRIVSLTITEKGYCLNKEGQLDLSHPAIVTDLNHRHSPKSAIGIIVAALQCRHREGKMPFTVMSCDNLMENGNRARAVIVEYAKQIDPELAHWINENVSFPLSMVDRITPGPNPAVSAQLCESVGIEDRALLVCEDWLQWVIEDQFNAGRPAFEKAGAEITDNIHLYEAMKVGLLNGSHLAMCHLGILLGHERVDQAASDPGIQKLLTGFMRSVEDTLEPLPGVCYRDYSKSLLTRFQNTAIKDALTRIAEDTSAKLKQCFLPTLKIRLARGLSIDSQVTVMALWIHYLHWLGSNPQAEYKDPEKDRLVSLADNAIKNNDCRELLAFALELEGASLNQVTEAVNESIVEIAEYPTFSDWLDQLPA